MKTLILKLNATGDVIRTTPLLRVLDRGVTWITAERNMPLLDSGFNGLKCLSWERRLEALDYEYDLVINLEDDLEVAQFGAQVTSRRVFGAYLHDGTGIAYSNDARDWFDMSLISRFGRARADELKLWNRHSYQHLLFNGLGMEFQGERYILPHVDRVGLRGDVALAAASGPVWPMKHWAYYPELKLALERRGLTVNVLPQRATMLEHVADVAGHRCIVGGDSLPMHLALGLGVRMVALFNCTSPWEIYPYGLLTKLVSPRLAEHFYKRTFDEAATRAIALEDVQDAVAEALEQASAPKHKRER